MVASVVAYIGPLQLMLNSHATRPRSPESRLFRLFVITIVLQACARKNPHHLLAIDNTAKFQKSQAFMKNLLRLIKINSESFGAPKTPTQPSRTQAARIPPKAALGFNLCIFNVLCNRRSCSLWARPQYSLKRQKRQKSRQFPDGFYFFTAKASELPARRAGSSEHIPKLNLWLAKVTRRSIADFRCAILRILGYALKGFALACFIKAPPILGCAGNMNAELCLSGARNQAFASY
ncbi:MAG: hypothetical protein LBT59_03975 [Clostridiales bacterium]|nr:hypothetical protein [Clostridiales bacterium]